MLTKFQFKIESPTKFSGRFYFKTVVKKRGKDINMAEKRKDNKGRNLRTGESQRRDGRYEYKYIACNGKRKTIYSLDLAELREKERQIQRDLEDGINAEYAKRTLNRQFEYYLQTKLKLRDTTLETYRYMWGIAIKDSPLGEMEIGKIKKSNILKVYATLSKKGYKNGTIQDIHNILHPTLQLAVDDAVIRSNPCKGCTDEYRKKDAKEKEALTLEEQNTMFEFMEGSIYAIYIPMIKFMIGTACRCSEMTGLTWEDVDMKERTISINHQLIYKVMDGQTRYVLHEPKTKKGKRVIPMTRDVYDALHEQKKLQLALGTFCNEEVCGLKGFVFTNRNARPIISGNVNDILRRLVNKCNENERKKAENEGREARELPHISAHTLRHTGCTRMAECGVDVKTLQYIMGHESIETTIM